MLYWLNLINVKHLDIIIFGIALFVSIPAISQNPMIIDDDFEEKILILSDLEYLVDSSNNLKIEDVITYKYQTEFKRSKSYQNKDFQPGSSYWIRFPVIVRSQKKDNWLIEFYDQTIDSIIVFQPLGNANFDEIKMGDHLPFRDRKYWHKNFEVMLSTAADTTLTYYFKIKSHEFADIRIAVKTLDRFIHYSLTEYYLYGIFYGMIIIISLYNLLVYLAIREIKSVYYIYYIVSVALYALSLDGVGFQYIWFNYPQWNDYVVGTSLYFVILWALIFTRSFLNTRINSPALDQALKWVIIFRSIIFVVEFSFFPELFTFRNLEIVPLSLIFLTGIKVWYDGYRPARFFVIAYGILFIGFFLRSLVNFNVLPFTILSHYSLHIAFVLEMLLLTFALGDRLRILKNNRDRALKRIIQQNEVNIKLQEKVNKELEQKVSERTFEIKKKNGELEESNKKLMQQTLEINQINSILDLDNWKLKNRIKEVLNERLMDKVLDYEEFKTLYPNKVTCYQFLEKLKWSEDFKCRKCKNEKSFSGPKKFSKRCTKCGYNESITAYTLFKNLKFPIEKAFYIAYLEVAGNHEKKLEELSHELAIGTNAVWHFKHKVAERIKEIAKDGHNPKISRWQEIILDPMKGRKNGSLKSINIAQNT